MEIKRAKKKVCRAMPSELTRTSAASGNDTRPRLQLDGRIHAPPSCYRAQGRGGGAGALSTPRDAVHRWRGASAARAPRTAASFLENGSVTPRLPRRIHRTSFAAAAVHHKAPRFECSRSPPRSRPDRRLPPSSDDGRRAATCGCSTAPRLNASAVFHFPLSELHFAAAATDTPPLPLAKD